MIHLYHGDGKGKTTAAMGQIVRCVGHGFKVLVYQFLKEPTSGEVSVIKSLPGVEYIANASVCACAVAAKSHGIHKYYAVYHQKHTNGQKL